MKASCCIIGLCLLLTSKVAAIDYEPKPLTEEEITLRKANFKDPAKLKDFLMGEFGEIDWSGTMSKPHLILAFKEGYDMQDEILRPVLMEIYHEAVEKTGWKCGDDGETERRLHSSIRWMGVFADEPLKKLLLNIAKDNAKHTYYRYPAILGYIYCADAQEVKNLFDWLLADEKRFSANLRGTLMEQIRGWWSEVQADTQKREVILASLSVAASQEKDAWTFGQLDDFLVQNSQGYAESPQRKKALQRINKSAENKPTENKATAWKLPLLIGILILGGVGGVWCCFRKRRGS